MLFGLMLAPFALADEPITFAEADPLIAEYGCGSCHSPYKASQAPTLHAIAVRYAADPHALQDLAISVHNGSVGAWGPTPMPPYDVPERDLKVLLKWTLSLR
jgi:cytochrome c